MAQFVIAATDKDTNATVFARITGRNIAFRTGYSITGSENRICGLNFAKGSATRLDAETACSVLVSETERLAKGKDAWIRDLRIVVA